MIVSVYADIYGHSPPFSNNRNQETNQNANNQNRLFNSQNNAKGGYCRGGTLEWYEKSILPITWTHQHGCGSDQTTCNVVLQYMCSDTSKAAPHELIRDGTTTDTIPENLAGTEEKENNNYKYGLHESYWYYRNCSTRSRNRGLFVATQTPGDTARSTRQQPGTTRYGFECPEERDYFPYWAPSPWKDIAVFTDNKKLCKLFQSESQNVKSKYYCKINVNPAPITKEDCTGKNGEWVEVPSHDIGKPECIRTDWTAVNHLGQTLNGGKHNNYNWSLPHSGMEPCIAEGTCNCVLRLRYNISNDEFDPWGFTDYKSNAGNSPITNDPEVMVNGQNLTVELNVAQYGRTFQDRTHVFRIKPRPNNLKKAKIWNLTVKGKRGNIVQVYPAQEYMFVPHQLTIKINEYIHFQWTGCDYNPDNTGNGRARTDRSNIVQIAHLNRNIPMKDEELTKKNRLFDNDSDRTLFAHLGQTNCLNYTELMTKHNNNENDIEQDLQNCMRLNAAPDHFDGGVIKMTKTGSFYYMSTRNNNFSNRDQKGAIHVKPILEKWEIALIVVGGTLFVGIAATGGSLFFARKHPHSGANKFFSKIPLLNKLL